jgi:hypothetical protein
MASGIVVLIIGAVFTFALRTDGSWMNTRVLGLPSCSVASRSSPGTDAAALGVVHEHGAEGREQVERELVEERLDRATRRRGGESAQLRRTP